MNYPLRRQSGPQQRKEQHIINPKRPRPKSFDLLLLQCRSTDNKITYLQYIFLISHMMESLRGRRIAWRRLCGEKDDIEHPSSVVSTVQSIRAPHLPLKGLQSSEEPLAGRQTAINISKCAYPNICDYYINCDNDTLKRRNTESSKASICQNSITNSQKVISFLMFKSKRQPQALYRRMIFTRRNSFLSIKSLYGFFLVCILIFQYTTVAAIDTCACSPSSITIELDFSRTCFQDSVQIGADTGIHRVECDISPHPSGGMGKSGVTDLVPVAVYRYSIFELSQNLRSIRTFSNDVDLQDKDNISFTSIVTDESITELVGGLQIVLEATNEKDELLLSYFIVQYSNSCTQKPFSVGDSLSWAVITEDGPTSPRSCPLDVQPSTVPTRHSTPEPTLDPSKHPTTTPTKRPTSEPTLQPSNSTPEPTLDPTKHPTTTATKRPTSEPTLQPSKHPTTTPSSRPTKATPNPTMQPSKRPIIRRTRLPTRPPTRPPNKATPEPTYSPTSVITRLPTKRSQKKPTQYPTEDFWFHPSKDHSYSYESRTKRSADN